HSIGRIADPETGAYPLEVWLDNQPDSPLREGMIANVQLPYSSVKPSPAIPAAAVFRRDGRTHVFTVDNGVASMAAVRIGRRNDSLVEVLEGISVGESVVVDGQFALRDGVQVSTQDVKP
ncbi:MAG: efflux RND transporter periplasmic adaptor subunit, partial [Pseudomonadales bacterium]